MGSYGATFKRLSEWTFERKAVLNENMDKDRLHKDLEAAVEENRRQWKLQQQADGESQRVMFDRKLDHLESFQERIENQESRYEAELAANHKARVRQLHEGRVRRGGEAAGIPGRGGGAGSSGGGSGAGRYEDDSFQGESGGEDDEYSQGYEDEDFDESGGGGGGGYEDEGFEEDAGGGEYEGDDGFQDERVGGWGSSRGGRGGGSEDFEEESVGGGGSSRGGGGSSRGGGRGRRAAKFEDENTGGENASKNGRADMGFISAPGDNKGSEGGSERAASGAYEQDFEEEEEGQRASSYGDDGFDAEEEEEEEEEENAAWLRKQDEEAVRRREKVEGSAATRGFNERIDAARASAMLLPGEMGRGLEALENPFFEGGVISASHKVQRECIKAEEKVVEMSEYDALGVRADWVLDPQRSMWGVGGQSDRIDQGGHRGVGPYEVNFGEGWRDVHISNLCWDATSGDLEAAMLSIGPVESVRVARFVDPKWSSGPMRGLKKCVAYVRFADAEDAKRCVMTMNGRALRVSRGYVMVEGEDMVRRTEAAEEAVDLCFPVAGMPAHLAAVQLFWAVRDGNVGGAARSLDAGVEASVRISPMDFPEGSQSAQDGGRQWPKLSYDGALGDTALHLASRYKDLKMVRMLLERGADPTQINEEGLVAAECVAEMGGRRKGAQMGRRSFRRGSVLDSDDEDDEDGEDHARLMDRGADEDELYDLLEAEREADGQSAAGEGDDGDKASLVSERLIVVPTVGAVIGDDGQVTLTGVPTVSLRQAPAAPPPAVWAGGAWKRLDRSFRGHERKGARFHGAGAGGRKTTGYSIPGPGYYWPQVRDAWNRARDATSAADGYGGRHPRGYSWGAVKTGTGSFSYQAVRHGKGTATRQATLGDGKGMELGFHPQLSRFGASHFAPVFAHEKGPEEEAKRRTPAAGAFSRKPGTGHCNIVDMDIPGPQAYTPAPEAPAPATVFATADRRFQSVFGDIPCQEGFFLGKTLEEANLPGPAEYTLPPERGVREGMQGATFGRDEYAGRYYPTELVTGIGPGPAGYNPTFVSDKSDTGWSFGTSSQRQELWTTGTGGPNYPGPGDYKLPPCYVTMEDAPAYSFQRAEYPERQHLVAIGRGEGTVGPGSYNVATCHCEGGPAWTIGWERRLAGEVAKEEMFVPVPEEGDV